LDLLRSRSGWLRASRESPLIGYRAEIDPEVERQLGEKYAYMVGEAGFRKAMGRLAELAAHYKFEVLVLGGSQTRAQVEVVGPLAVELGFHFLDMGPVTEEALRARGVEPSPENYRKYLRVAPGDPHPSVLGHVIYAEAIVEKLREVGLLSVKP
jgi:hypothetical protein